jgi:murein DD-endopeptidase MepM/ murein hydrolase activator NlpD
MKAFTNSRIRLSIFIFACAWLAACGRLTPPDQNANLPAHQNTNTAIVRENSPTPTQTATPIVEEVPQSIPSPSSTAPAENAADSLGDSAAAQNNEIVVIKKLIIPVQGVKASDLRDTFKDARSEGRVHDAIDIMAPMGAPVLAAADGEIARFFDSEKGGITIYQFSADKKLIYYYAHLQRRADTVQEHQFVKQGTVIGYVGDTGNAGAGNTHLHFAVWTVTDPKRYWDGTNINPYTLLH